MSATAVLAAIEDGIAAYKRTNNALAFIAALGGAGYRIVPRDYEAEAKADADDAHYTAMWEQSTKRVTK